MTKKNIFPVVATIAVVGVVLGVFSMTVMRDSNVSISTMTSEQAYANLSSKMKRIGVQVVKDNLDEYLIYAVNEMALLPSVMFAIYIDGIYYANRGVYVDDATTINCEYSLNEEVLSHYDPNFVKGL